MNELKPTLALVIFVWLVTFFAMNLFAQDLNSTARIAGMGYSSEAIINGVDALGTNPALIGLPKGTYVSIAVVPFSFDAGMDFFDYSTYSRYFTGTISDITGKREGYVLSDADKQNILDAFPGSDGDLRLNAAFKLFGLVVSTPFLSIGMHMTDKIGTKAAIPRDLIEFLLYGNTPGKTFDFSPTNLYSSWTREYGLTFAKRFELVRRGGLGMTFGATVKYVTGFGYLGIDRFDTRFTTDPDNFDVTGRANMHVLYTGTEWMMNRDIFQFQLFPEPVGHGIGVDLGTQAFLAENFRIGLSIVDLGAITWDRNTYEISTDEIFTLADISSSEQTEEIKRKLGGTETAISGFSSSLPSAATVSIAYSIKSALGSAKPLHLTAALRQGFNDLPGNSTIPRAGAGMEWEFLESLPIRCGVSFGGGQQARFGVGLGLIMDSMTVDIATNNLETFFSKNFSSASIALSSRLDF